MRNKDRKPFEPQQVSNVGTAVKKDGVVTISPPEDEPEELFVQEKTHLVAKDGMVAVVTDSDDHVEVTNAETEQAVKNQAREVRKQNQLNADLASRPLKPIKAGSNVVMDADVFADISDAELNPHLVEDKEEELLEDDDYEEIEVDEEDPFADLDDEEEK